MGQKPYRLYVMRPGWVVNRHNSKREYLTTMDLRRLYNVPWGSYVTYYRKGMVMEDYHVLCEPLYSGEYPESERKC